MHEHSYCVLDIETDGSEVRDRFCDPLEKSHKVVMLQTKEANRSPKYIYDNSRDVRSYLIPEINGALGLIVGQNIKFDLLYLWENSSIRNFIARGGQLWDTKLAEYLIHGQNRLIRYGLDAVAPRYGGTIKPDEIKKHYDAGRLTSQIIDLIGLTDYLEYALGDTINTEKIYLGQLQIITPQQLNLIQIYMRHYIALIIMEFNGAYINKVRLEKKINFFTERKEVLNKEIKGIVEKYWDPKLEFDFDSNDDLSILLFGGPVKYTEIVQKLGADGQPEVFKSGEKKGQIKLKKQVVVRHWPGMGLPITNATPVKKEGFYSTNYENLMKVNLPVTNIIIEYRSTCKILQCLVGALKDHLNPYTGCVHSNFNPCPLHGEEGGTVTGRLSSSKPNMQNLSPEAHDVIIPRHKDWLIVEMDFKQLEVAVAAYVFNEPILKAELLNGVDIHLENARKLFGRQEITSVERKTAKYMTFEIQYGSGYRSLAAKHKISIDLAKKFIKEFYEKYTTIALEHTRIKNQVRNGGEWSTKLQCNYFFMETPWGKRYFVHDYYDEKKNIRYFSVPEALNKKIQGTASDIMNAGIANALDFIIENNHNMIMVNEVHDSLIFEVHKDNLHLAEQIKLLIEQGAKQFTSTDLFKLDIKIGKNWKECKEQ